MHGTCFDFSHDKWFDFKVPRTSIAPDFIKKAIEEPELNSNPNSRILFTGKQPTSEIIQKSKKGAKWELMLLSFQTIKGIHTISVDPDKGAWLCQLLPQLQLVNPKIMTLKEVMADYEKAGLEDFDLFWDNKPVNGLWKAGLLRI